MNITFDLSPKQEVYKLLNNIGFIIRNNKNYHQESLKICEMFLKETLEFSETCRGRTFIFKERDYLEKMIEELEAIKSLK